MHTGPSYLFVFFVTGAEGAKMGFFFGGRFVSGMGFVPVLLQKGRVGIYPGCDVFPSLNNGKKSLDIGL